MHYHALCRTISLKQYWRSEKNDRKDSYIKHFLFHVVMCLQSLIQKKSVQYL